jgi:ribosomal-protein-alanine N-acetyltransferase
MKKIFILGKQIYLRPLEREDLNERYLGWLNDPEIKYLESGIFPNTQDKLEKFYEKVVEASDQVILAVVDKESDLHIGNVKLGPINWVHRRATFGILIGDKKFWGKGVGEEATRLMVEYAFRRLNLHRVELGVTAENEGAICCYEKVGFQIEGRFRGAVFHEGRYKDSLWMGLLSSDYSFSWKDSE